MTHNIIAGVDYGPLLAALRSHDSKGIDAAYADIQKQVYGRNAPVRHDPDGMGGDWPVPSEEALDWVRDFNAAMEKR
jgi:hypothetical protein